MPLIHSTCFNSLRHSHKTLYCNLLPGVDKAHGVERDLANEGVVGHHHSDGSEEHLQVVGQLLATRVAGVHGNEHGARRVQCELSALEHESVTNETMLSL